MKNILFCLLIGFVLLGCSDDFLNRQPLDKISSAGVFQDENLLLAYMNNLQGRLPYGIHGSTGYGQYPCMIAAITDEARSKSGWVENNTVIIKGAISPTSTGGLGLWSSAYRTIRIANDLLAGIEDSSLEEEFKNNIAARARYVRAFTYFDLVRRYGDVPLISEPQSLEDDLLVSRTPQSEVYDFIYSELSEAVKDLTNKSEEPAGTITKQAAIAINARAMLYAERWEEAAALADQIINGDLNDGIDLHTDYRELFLSYGGNNETIMEKITLPPITGHSFGLFNWPVRWRSDWGGQTNPTQELVNSYEMAETGLPISDPTSGYNPDRPYEGRDKRFYASIFYHGSEFSEVAPSSGEPYIDMEWNNFNEGPGDKKHGAASITGYLVKKFVDPNEGFGPKRYESKTSWQEIRFAEVLLIYAEAKNEANGPTEKVYEAINRIRRRAELPDLPTGLSKDDMRKRIRHERKIELVFENHRWFDLIRWGIAEEILNGYVPHGIRIERKPDAPTHTEKPQLFEQDLLTFTPFEVPGRTQSFPASHSLLPIPQSEIDKNENLKPNNPGY